MNTANAVAGTLPREINPAAEPPHATPDAGVAAPTTRGLDPESGKRIAAALRHKRLEASRQLMNSVAQWEKYEREIATSQSLDEFVLRDYSFMTDYLTLRCETGDLTYRDLFIGEKIRQAFYEPESGVEAQIARRRQIIEADTQGLVALLGDQLQGPDLAILRGELGEIGRILTTRAERSLEVLLIGDCLFLDVMAFLAGPALEDGISINPTLVMAKNPAMQRNELRAMAGCKFDLIFYSPFTYEFANDYSRLAWWHQGALPGARIKALAQSAMDDARPTIDLLGELFESRIFVHNSANFRRSDGSARERLKNLLSWRARRTGRRHLNAMLDDWVRQRNAAGFDQLFIFDEIELLKRHGEAGLGRLFYDHDSRHPAAMGRWVAERYRDLVATQAQLLKKKVIVCDLDETLWKGVIGEGAVQHYTHKQETLKQLKAKGVLLAINSKNDLKNIHWDGAVLGPDDFVSVQINWETKAGNLKRIAQHLNLKAKDFVFIDDRPDEREMVRMSMPEVQVLDALDERSWRLLDLWRRMLAGDDNTDRTQLYREKEARDGFLQGQSTALEDPAELFKKLELTVTVRDARAADLKRVVELINRTNQFNTCGSRTSLREASEWLAAGDRQIKVVDCGDKFGTMGTICICVSHRKADRIEIPVFVLSCRVFGYGIENLLVNDIKRAALQAGVPVAARLVETAHNEPCRRVYPDSGFAWDGSEWIWRGEGPIEDPAWLKVRNE